MNARQEALIAYGGKHPSCVWCGCDDPTQLELDHIAGGQGQGNAHRREIKGKLEYWLKAQGFPPGLVRLLCRHCHDLKSGRIRRMPPGKGSQDVHISLRDDLVERLTVLASAPGMTRSKVMEAALVQHLEHGASETLLAGLQQRFDTTAQALGEVTKALQALDLKVSAQGSRMDRMEQRFQSFIEAVNSLYDHEKASRNGQGKAGFVETIFGRKGRP
jgi:predicted transcriptional regulator